MTLKELRESKGLTRRQVSDATGISLRSLQDYEQGHKAITSAKGETIYHLSLALGCSMEDVLVCENQLQMEFVEVSEEARRERLQAYYEQLQTGGCSWTDDEQDRLQSYDNEIVTDHASLEGERQRPQIVDEKELQISESMSENELAFDYFQNAEHLTRADVEATELFSREYQVYARWLFVNGECFLTFMYDGEWVLLPFRVIFNEKRMPWLPDMAEMDMDCYIEEVEFQKNSIL